MLTIKAGRTAYFDVDDTLLKWESCSKHENNAVKVINNGHTFYKQAIYPNVEALKDHSQAGHVVVVWSAGGVEWAESVIHALRLEKYVDIVLTKPDWYYDDKEADHWLPERQFKGDNAI